MPSFTVTHLRMCEGPIQSSGPSENQVRSKITLALSPMVPVTSIPWDPKTPAVDLGGILPLQTKAPEEFVVAEQIATIAGAGEDKPVR